MRVVYEEAMEDRKTQTPAPANTGAEAVNDPSEYMDICEQLSRDFVLGFTVGWSICAVMLTLLAHKYMRPK